MSNQIRRKFLCECNSSFMSMTEKFEIKLYFRIISSTFHSRILELLRALEFPGSENFDETDIDIFARTKGVKEFFIKVECGIFFNLLSAIVFLIVFIWYDRICFIILNGN